MHIRVAAEFSKRISADLGTETMAKVRAANAARNDGSCATHDYCNSNETMIEAMFACGLPFSGESDWDKFAANPSYAESFNRIWNDSWDLAKLSGFRIGWID